MKPPYTRPYQAETDYNQMRRLLSESYLLAGPPVYCTVGDLDWWRCLEDDPHIRQPVLGKWIGIMPGRRLQRDLFDPCWLRLRRQSQTARHLRPARGDYSRQDRLGNGGLRDREERA
jgi:hypothetical protein